VATTGATNTTTDSTQQRQPAVFKDVRVTIAAIVLLLIGSGVIFGKKKSG
jgi:hypothetical protein